MRRSTVKWFGPLVMLLLLTGSGLAQRDAGYPATFNLINVNGQNFVTTVKSQTGGTCWAHAVMASMESNLKVTGAWAAAGESGEPNLAEYHLDWWNGFNDESNTDAENSLQGLIVHEGGDYLVASAYMSRGDGMVRDFDGQVYAAPGPDLYLPSYHLFYAREIAWLVGETRDDTRVNIKKALMTHGAVGTCMYANSRYINENYVHYQPEDQGAPPNHAVTIVGWDDALPVSQDVVGAWYVKNSWGMQWGHLGFFWIAYDDFNAGMDPKMGAVSFQDVEPLQYSDIYSHDFHGWRYTKDDCQQAFNAFVTQAGAYLSAVSFFTAQEEVNYTVTVYDDFDGSQLSTVLAECSGQAEATGFHTVDVDEPVFIPGNETFYVQVNLDEGGHAFDGTSAVDVLLGTDHAGAMVPSSANPGESYYLEENAWHDLTDLNETANFCIKALMTTEPSTSVEEETAQPNTFVLESNYPNPFNPETVIPVTVARGGLAHLAVYNVRGQRIATLFDGMLPAGHHEFLWNGCDPEGRNLATGVYFYRLKTAAGVEMRKMTLIR